MKKIILFLSIISIISCKEEAPIDYALISGQILNTDAAELSVYSADRKIKYTLPISMEGLFNDTIRDVFGFYSFYDGKNYHKIYIESGDDLKINYDAKDFNNTLNYSGMGGHANNYLKVKESELSEISKDRITLYSLDENAFKTKLNEDKTQFEKLITDTDSISESFRAGEINDIKYDYLNKLNNYERSHSYYTKSPDFKVSETFLSDFEGFDYNNETDFNFSSNYKSLVSSYYRNLANDLIISDSLERGIAYLKTLQAIPSTTIKNVLSFDEASFGIKYTNDINTYYQLFSETSTNNEYNTKIREIYDNLKLLAPGQPSPKFIEYKNYDGSKTSLDDLKGKYVYIDVWATWCGPCKAEIPYLQKVEEDYHGKNIHFVSLSVDKTRDIDKWENMIAEKEMTGIQIIADNDFSSEFVKGYMINAIPQFILLDPEGNIVEKNAPRPSDKRLVQLFDELNI